MGFRGRRCQCSAPALRSSNASYVEIARALAAGRRCLLLDEPTSALERAEIQRLFERVRSMVANGVAVLYISHHLEEVFEVCDDVAVLRDGELVMSRPTAGLSKDELVAVMVGPHAATIAGTERAGAKTAAKEQIMASRAWWSSTSRQVRPGAPCATCPSRCATGSESRSWFVGAGVATLARA